MTTPTISAASASELTTRASQSTSDCTNRLSAMIANTAAATNMPSPIASPRTFSDISALNSASSLRARSVESRNASPIRRWMLSPCGSAMRSSSGAALGVGRPRRTLRPGTLLPRTAALALPRSAGRAGAAAAPRFRLANVLGRALDEPGREEAGEHRRDRDRTRAAAHQILAELEDLVEAAFADRIGELLEAPRGAVDEAADVRAVVELAARVAQRGREIGDDLCGLVLALVDVARRLILCRIERRSEEGAPALHGGAGDPANLVLESAPVLRPGAGTLSRCLVLTLLSAVARADAHGKPPVACEVTHGSGAGSPIAHAIGAALRGVRAGAGCPGNAPAAERFRAGVQGLGERAPLGGGADRVRHLGAARAERLA